MTKYPFQNDAKESPCFMLNVRQFRAIHACRAAMAGGSCWSPCRWIHCMDTLPWGHRRWDCAWRSADHRTPGWASWTQSKWRTRSRVVSLANPRTSSRCAHLAAACRGRNPGAVWRDRPCAAQTAAGCSPCPARHDDHPAAGTRPARPSRQERLLPHWMTCTSWCSSAPDAVRRHRISRQPCVPIPWNLCNPSGNGIARAWRSDHPMDRQLALSWRRSHPRASNSLREQERLRFIVRWNWFQLFFDLLLTGIDQTLRVLWHVLPLEWGHLKVAALLGAGGCDVHGRLTMSRRVRVVLGPVCGSWGAKIGIGLVNAL